MWLTDWYFQKRVIHLVLVFVLVQIIIIIRCFLVEEIRETKLQY